jgi:hypothetical protein
MLLVRNTTRHDLEPLRLELHDEAVVCVDRPTSCHRRIVEVVGDPRHRVGGLLSLPVFATLLCRGTRVGGRGERLAFLNLLQRDCSVMGTLSAVRLQRSTPI